MRITKRNDKRKAIWWGKKITIFFLFVSSCANSNVQCLAYLCVLCLTFWLVFQISICVRFFCCLLEKHSFHKIVRFSNQIFGLTCLMCEINDIRSLVECCLCARFSLSLCDLCCFFFGLFICKRSRLCWICGLPFHGIWQIDANNMII